MMRTNMLDIVIKSMIDLTTIDKNMGGYDMI